MESIPGYRNHNVCLKTSYRDTLCAPLVITSNGPPSAAPPISPRTHSGARPPARVIHSGARAGLGQSSSPLGSQIVGIAG